MAAVLASQSAPAQVRAGQDAGMCVAGTGGASLVASVCTRAIRTGGYQGLTLATLYVGRGKARMRRGRNDLGIADFDRALEHNPLSAEAHRWRGAARHADGDHAGAITDFDRALALFPGFARALRDRGTARFFLGDLAGAERDLDATLELSPNDGEAHAVRGFVRDAQGRRTDALADFEIVERLDFGYPYTALWLYLTRPPAGEDGRRALVEDFADLLDEEWPRALVAVYLGQASPETALAEAAASGTDIGTRRQVETRYFLGRLALLQGDAAGAARHFEHARTGAAASPLAGLQAGRALESLSLPTTSRNGGTRR
jgi:lipoprotein NlpI